MRVIKRVLSNDDKFYQTSLAFQNCILDVLEAEGKKITSCEKVIISKIAINENNYPVSNKNLLLVLGEGYRREVHQFLKKNWQ